MSQTICDDDMQRIREFSELGLGRKKIADYLGISEYAVKTVLEGKVPVCAGGLSTRQRQNMINAAFRPVGKRKNNSPTPTETA